MLFCLLLSRRFHLLGLIFSNEDTLTLMWSFFLRCSLLLIVVMRCWGTLINAHPIPIMHAFQFDRSILQSVSVFMHCVRVNPHILGHFLFQSKLMWVIHMTFLYLYSLGEHRWWHWRVWMDPGGVFYSAHADYSASLHMDVH